MTRTRLMTALAPLVVVGLLLAPSWIWPRPATSQILTPVTGNPASIAGLTLWYKANTLALNDADPIASVTDWSGAGYTGTQGTAGYKPLYKTAIQNGLGVMRFDGSDDALGFSSLSLGTAHTIFAVLNMAGGLSTSSVAVWFGGATNYYSHYKDDSDKWVYSVPNGTGTPATVLSNADAYSAAFRIVATVRNGTAVAWYKNGAALGSGTLAANTAQALTTIGYGGTPKPNADLAEVLVYNVALSTANQKRVERYLCQKYQITCS